MVSFHLLNIFLTAVVIDISPVLRFKVMRAFRLFVMLKYIRSIPVLDKNQRKEKTHDYTRKMCWQSGHPQGCGQWFL